MPLRLKFHVQAERDLDAIIFYIARQNGDFVVAQRFGLRLVERCEKISSAPGKGMPHGPRPNIRKVNEGAYKIFYQVTMTHVLILRIWDGRRGRNPRL